MAPIRSSGAAFLRLALVVVLAIVLGWLASRLWVKPVSAAGDLEGSLVVDGRTRSYRLHLPPGYDARTPLPLVINLHGGGGRAQAAERMSGMNAKADKENFIAVYPNGSGRFGDRLLTWNSGNCCAYARVNNVDDTAFVRALIAKLEHEYAVDSRRIYATGMSNGVMMSHRLGCELSDKLAAIAPVAGALNVPDCRPAQPISVVIFHGTADRHVRYEGGKPYQQADRLQRTDNSVAYAVNFWVRHNGCSPTPQTHKEGMLRTDSYTGCRAGTAVTLYTLEGEGHTWPGGVRYLPTADPPSTSVSATNLMWSFFSSHPKR